MTLSSRLSLGLLLLALAASPAAAADAKRVLIVHSFGSAAPPFMIGSTAFQTTLTDQMGRRVDLDEVSLGMDRYPQPDMEAPLVAFLPQRLAKWRPDLVVPIGLPAGLFVAKYRDRLFPRTPILYLGMDRRGLPPDALRTNATFVGQELDAVGLVDDILQLAPATTNIAMVIGASPLERYWVAQLRHALEPLSPRVTFTWLDGLSFEDTLDRAASLPPNSFILLVLLVRDAAGVSHNQDEALRRLHAVANAPINGVFQHELGLGIVGGRLYQAEAQGIAAARVAARVLRGEPISSIPPQVIPPQTPRYDWRELQRWQIAESRLPPGSVIEFRIPSLWSRHRWLILATLLVALVQAGLITQLALSLAKRRRVHEELRESEARLNVAADSAGAGLWTLDLRTRQVWATPRLRELFDLTPAQALTEQTFLDVIHPQDREGIRLAVERAAEGRGPLGAEFRIVRADGTERWIATRGELEGGRRHRVARLSGASLDITQRILAEQRLRESESRFRAIADSAPVLIWVSGVDKMCTFFNKPWLDFTGRTLEQELGSGWAEGVHPDDLAGCLAAYGASFDARQPFTLQYRLRRHDGEYRWILDVGVPRQDAQGAFAGYIGSCSDVTERLRTEEKFRQIFEGAPIVMIMVNEAGQITLVNDHADRVFGYPREELIGMPIQTLISERPRTGPQADPQAFFGRRKDGSDVPVEVGLNPIHTVDGLFFVASVVDTTERQRAEAERLRLHQDLVHMTRVATMGELTAAIVHELGQSLTAILTNARVGLHLLASGDQEAADMRDILADIVADNQRAGDVIQHLRSFFKKGDMERRPVQLNDLINDVIRVVRAEADRRELPIIVELDPGLPPVLGDRVQLQQVLLNLMVNAFEAMVDVTGGPRTVTVRTRTLEGHQVQVDVADTGPGIAPDTLGSMFKPFVTTKAGGMGIGLSVSDSIVRAHAGRLSAENAPKGGAVLHVTLPTARDEDAAAG